MIIPNLLLVAGTGNKSGKTTFVCRIIEQFRDLNITGIKITPHFHEDTPGLELIISAGGYAVYEETNAGTGKDTSRMLSAGAAKVFFLKVTEKDLLSGFNALLSIIPEGIPLVCESPGLRYFIEPGLFVIMKSRQDYNHKNINGLLELPHVIFHLEKLQLMKEVPVQFAGGKWVSRSDTVERL